MHSNVGQIWKSLHNGVKILIVSAGAAALALAIWLASPLFFSTTVNEDFPVSAPTRAPAATTPILATPIPATPAASEAAVPTTAPEGHTPTTTPTATSEPVQTEPQVLSSGSFTRVDDLHAAEGSATIYRTPEGQLILRLENFKATNGPDLYVSLSGHPMPRSSDEAHASGYREIARLKASQGNQNYELPADLDPTQYRSVVIYCRAFSVVFSTAELE